MTVKSFSFLLKGVWVRERRTPRDRKRRATRIRRRAGRPAFRVQGMSMAAPTRTKRMSSVASHSFPNFSERRWATKGVLLSLRMAARVTMARSPERGSVFLRRASTAMRRKERPRSMMTLRLFLM